MFGRRRNINDLPSAWDGSARRRNLFLGSSDVTQMGDCVTREGGGGLPGKERAWICQIYGAKTSREVYFTGASEALWITGMKLRGLQGKRWG